MKWRQIYGFENYEINTIGEIRSKTWKDILGRNKPGKLMKTFNSYGYRIISLRKNGKSYTKPVHRLLLETFVGPRKFPKWESAHLNGKRDDNRLENLKWCTRKINCSHKIQHGTTNRGNRNGRAKLKIHQVMEIREMLSSNQFYYHEIASKFNITPEYVGQLRRGKTWKYIGSKLSRTRYAKHRKEDGDGWSPKRRAHFFHT